MITQGTTFVVPFLFFEKAYINIYDFELIINNNINTKDKEKYKL